MYAGTSRTQGFLSAAAVAEAAGVILCLLRNHGMLPGQSVGTACDALAQEVSGVPTVRRKYGTFADCSAKRRWSLLYNYNSNFV